MPDDKGEITGLSKIRIFGSPQSRAFRAIWAAREMGVDYDLADYKTPDFAKVNPNAKIPAGWRSTSSN